MPHVYLYAAKFAQAVLDQAHLNIYKNHVIRVNQQAQILINSAKDGLRAGTIVPDTIRYAESLHNFAVQYTSLVLQTTPPDTNQLKNLFKEMIGLYDTISKHYIDPKFDPMKQIRESLFYIGKFGPIDMFSAGADTNISQPAV
jgi:hypothetical protein